MKFQTYPKGKKKAGLEHRSNKIKTRKITEKKLNKYRYYYYKETKIHMLFNSFNKENKDTVQIKENEEHHSRCWGHRGPCRHRGEDVVTENQMC